MDYILIFTCSFNLFSLKVNGVEHISSVSVKICISHFMKCLITATLMFYWLVYDPISKLLSSLYIPDSIYLTDICFIAVSSHLCLQNQGRFLTVFQHYSGANCPWSNFKIYPVANGYFWEINLAKFMMQ